jgi:F-type H+-transporting ATPase subunit a
VSLLALDLFEHIPGWFDEHGGIGLAQKVGKLFFGPDATGEQIARVEVTLYGWFLAAPLVLLLCWMGTRNMKRVPTGLQNLFESIVKLLDDFASGMLGAKHGPYFATAIGAMFIYIHVSNVWGMIPGMGASTSVASTTLALAIFAFFLTHWAGFRFAGVGYLKHFAGDVWWLAPLMFVIHICGELARPLSLCMRLMGNIGGEEKATAIFISLGLATGLFIPVQVPLLALGLLTTFLQALVFCLLTCAYVAGALPHDHDHHHDHGHDHDHANAHGGVAVQPA